MKTLQRNISIIACLLGTIVLVGLGFYFCNNKRLVPQKPYTLEFTSLTDTNTPKNLSITGSIPGWLTGSLFWLGPAHFQQSQNSHYLDGHAMIHKFSLSADGIIYAHKFLKTDLRTKQQTHSNAYPTFASDQSHSMSQKIQKIISPNTASVHTKEIYDNPLFGLSPAGDALIALSPYSAPQMINPKTLNTLPKPLACNLYETFNFSTRECYDPHEKVYYGISLSWETCGGYHLYKRAPYSSMRTLITTIASNKTSFISSFSITKKNILIVAHPLVIDHEKAQHSGMPQLNNLKWCPHKSSRIYSIEKATGRQIGRYEAPAFFSMHHINAFEIGNELNIDIITHHNPKLLSHLYLKQLHSQAPNEGFSSYAQRITIDTGTGQLNMRNLTSKSVEMPMINQSYTGEPYQYFYALHGNAFNEQYDTLVKVSLTNQLVTPWHEDGCYPGRPIFVAAPEAEREDDGVILSIVLDSKHKRSFLIILDAATMQEKARANLEHHIPIGLCGLFLN